MKQDRKEICNIITEMLDNPDKCGIYPTSTAYTKLELYVEKVRLEAIGWTYAEACVSLDRGEEIRTKDVPELLARALKELDNTEVD